MGVRGLGGEMRFQVPPSRKQWGRGHRSGSPGVWQMFFVVVILGEVVQVQPCVSPGVCVRGGESVSLCKI